jgi:iron(III) transport system ATP-binding protein
MIAGFEDPTGGRVLVNNHDITAMPPNRRGIGLVFQNYALFPHLSVAKNLSFGLEVQNLSKAEISERVEVALRQVQLDARGASRIDQLSGGQQQRVALARALVIRPALLLLDEPLSNLDAKLREETRAMLRDLHRSTGITTVYVTHDQTEAMAMSDRIAILNQGKLLQIARPEEIYERPANRFVADFIGRNNVVEATIVGFGENSGVIRFANGSELKVGSHSFANDVSLKAGLSVGVCLRAESLRITPGEGIFQGMLTDVEYRGVVHSCVVKTDIGKLRIEVPSTLGRPAQGESVRISVVGTAVHIVAGDS